MKGSGGKKVGPSAGTKSAARAVILDPEEGEAQKARTVEEICESVKAVTGIRSGDVAEWISCQVVTLIGLGEKHEAKDGLKRIAAATSTLDELGPENATQAMLATQMVGVHEAAIKFLRRAFIDGQTVEGVELNVNRSTRLMRLFREQLEAMQKLKGTSGQQKVVVEHVHVHQGGQAIVGAVSSGGGGQT